MTDTARILSTAQIVCTAKKPAGDGRSRLGFCSADPYGDPDTMIGPSGLSLVMRDQAANHIQVGTYLTLVFTDGVIG